MNNFKKEFRNKNILVTGGTGSIGSEIVRQLIKYEPRTIRIFARHEEKHYRLMQELGVGTDRHKCHLRFIVGDIRDKERLRLAMNDINIVFHAAALKQVPMCEDNPFEAVKTNILGTQNIIDLAHDLNIEKVIAISTDKAVNPTSVMGVSKLMAEKLILASYYYQGKKRTNFACVRFGNVLGSAGSILPTIKEQIRNNNYVTITNPKMTRFVMSIPQAVELLLNTSSLMQGQEIFVLKMPAVSLDDLIQASIEVYAPVYNKKLSDIKLKITGSRQGEKDHELLLNDSEIEKALETKNMYILTPSEKFWRIEYKKEYPGTRQGIATKNFSSQYAPRLSRKEIIELIKKTDADFARK